MTAPALEVEDSPLAEPALSRYRWTICALLFFATTINYIDRQVLGILAPTLQRELGWSETDYGSIVSWFTLAYALGFLFAGRMMDRIGVRLGFTAAIVTWSLAAMGHAFASTAAGFSAARFALGLGESANFPGSIKTVAEWFPARERAFATGIFNAGTNVGAIVTPLVVPWITLRWGWRTAFIVTGTLGFIWLIFWLLLYRSPAEKRAVGTPPMTGEHPIANIPWIKLLGYRQTWALVVGKGLTDPVWWFYLFWLPKFLDARFGIKLGSLALPLVVIYLVADVGSVGGGWLSAPLVKRGWSLNKARKTALLIPALLIVPTMLAPRVNDLWMAVAIVSLAAAAHQWWSANIYTLSSDMFPRRAVGSVVGIGGFAGAATGFFFQRLTGHILQANNNDYRPVFVFCGLAYVTAWAIVQLLVPRLEPIDFDERQAA
jgi:MFS transporter, ACS family, aldohexuronate transporter